MQQTGTASKRTVKSGIMDGAVQISQQQRGKSLGTSKAVIDITVMQNDDSSVDKLPDSPSPTYNTGNLNDI